MFFKDNNRGIVLISAYMVIFVLLSLLGVYATRSINENSLAERQEKNAEAFYIAEAGIQKALWIISNNPSQINNDSWLMAQTNVNNNLGNGSFQVQITGSASIKNITGNGTVSSINRQILVQVQNSWLSKIPAAVYSKNVSKIKFDKRDDAYIDGKNMPGIYSTNEVKTKKGGEGRIDGNPPILENQKVPEGLQDGIWDAFDVNALREMAKANGTYFQGDEYNKGKKGKKGKYTLPVAEGKTNGVFFFDTKGGVVFDDDAIDKKNEAKIELKGTTELMSGVIVVLGDLTIKDTKDYDFLFDGVILVLDDLKMHDNKHGRRDGTNDSDIFIRGAILSDDIIQKGKKRKKKPTTDIKNATIEYDAGTIANASSHWGIISGSWQEL